ncbi:MAG: imidazolonepropionase [Gammaproteobacteria bacterium]|nr:imidazolonepropionase [Gammaproteobacteria bacterium]
MVKWDALWVHARVCACESGIQIIEDAAIAVLNGKIAWVGPMSALPGEPERLAQTIHDVHHHLMTPGFIDCHTHLVYAGNRAPEFEQRLLGMSYADITQSGGGIQSTVKATRDASVQDLLEQSLKRAIALMNSGVTTVEIKSGYGLDWDNEVKMLRVAAMIEAQLPLTVKKTFLGAHVVPTQFKTHPEKYVTLICEEMIPRIAREKLADSVDVFCETIAFDLAQTRTIFEAAVQHGLSIKCHAEQLSDMGGAALAASFGALSVDHLECLSEKGVQALAQSGTVAVLLPAAFYFLRETRRPPIQALRQAAVPIALATDSNPGTAPITSMLWVLNMACTLFFLTVEEALLGVTKHAAKALGLEHTHGTLKVGKQADFAIWAVKHPAELAYYMGADLLFGLVKDGKPCGHQPHHRTD